MTPELQAQLDRPRLLLTREVAAALRIGVERVHELVALGVLTPVRLTPRGHFRFRVEDVERLIGGQHGDARPATRS